MAYATGFRPAVPKKGASPGEIKRFLENVISYDNTYRIELMRRFERARLYYRGQQWLETDITEDPTRSPFMRPIQVDPTRWFPMPVFNVVFKPTQQEAARLSQRGSEPWVKPEQNTPKIHRACKLGKDVLSWKLEANGWTTVDQRACSSAARFGTGIYKGCVEVNYAKTSRYPLEKAWKCPVCDFRLTDRKVPKDATNEMLEGPAMGEGRVRETRRIESPNNKFIGDELDLRVDHCLTCDTPMPIMEYAPSEAEQDRVDHFGRSLGEDVPEVDWACYSVPAYNIFPDNQGVGCNYDTVTAWGEGHIETLEWIRQRYKNGVFVKPEQQALMLRWHPILGGGTYYFAAGGAPDATLFNHHAKVMEWHCEPFVEDDGQKNLGRSMAMAGDVVLLDDDYLIESQEHPGEYVRRVVYNMVPWEESDNEAFGIGMIDLGASLQDVVNIGLAQALDANHRHGSPKLLIDAAVDLSYQGGGDSGYPGDIIRFTPGLSPTAQKPDFIQGHAAHPQWLQIQDISVQQVPQMLGLAEVETGQPPGGVEAAQALMYLGTKAAEGRIPRGERFRLARMAQYKHCLEVIHEFYREDRYYKVRGKNDSWDIRSFRGTDLLGQTNVVIDEQAVQNDKAYQAVVTTQALDKGWIVPSTPAAKRNVSRVLGIPLHLDEDQNRQVEQAEEEWLAFYEDGKDPVVDVSADSHPIHTQQHLSDWDSDECKKLRDLVDWDRIELTLWGWQEDLAALQMMEQRIKEEPPGEVPPQMIEDGTGNYTVESVSAFEQWKMLKMFADKIAGWPKAPELRLQIMWANMLTGSPGALDHIDPQNFIYVPRLLRWRSHIEVHKTVASGQTQAANAGAAIVAPPSGPETQQGMIPGQGEATIPGPGAGEGALTQAAGGPV